MERNNNAEEQLETTRNLCNVYMFETVLSGYIFQYIQVYNEMVKHSFIFFIDIQETNQVEYLKEQSKDTIWICNHYYEVQRPVIVITVQEWFGKNIFLTQKSMKINDELVTWL